MTKETSTSSASASVFVLAGFAAGVTLCWCSLSRKAKKEEKEKKKPKAKGAQEEMRSLTQWHLRIETSEDTKKMDNDGAPEDGESLQQKIVIHCPSSGEEYTSQQLTNLDGVTFPGFMIPSRHRYNWLRRNIKLRPGDVCVATYPKCGTTWAENIVLLLLHGPQTPLDPLSKNTYNPKVSGSVGKIWPIVNVWEDHNNTTLPHAKGEFRLRMSLDEFDSVPGRRVIKSHMQRGMFFGADLDTNALPAHAKVVVVTRAPKDALVSMYYHFGAFYKPSMPAFDGFVTHWLSGNINFGSWYEYTRAWYASALQSRENGDGTILFLHYEAMKADPVAAVKRIADFIGVETTPEMCAAVAENSSFSSMKKKALEAEKDQSNNGEKSTHLRSGKVGDWRNHFTEKTLSEFEFVSRVKRAAAATPFPDYQ